MCCCVTEEITAQAWQGSVAWRLLLWAAVVAVCADAQYELAVRKLGSFSAALHWQHPLPEEESIA